MNIHDLEALRFGSLIQDSRGKGFVVTEKLGDRRATAVRSIHVTNPPEWRFNDNQLQDIRQLNIGDTLYHPDFETVATVVELRGTSVIAVEVKTVNSDNLNFWKVYQGTQ